MSSMKCQKLFDLIKIDNDYREFMKILYSNFDLHPFLTVSYLIKETDYDFEAVIKLLLPFIQCKLLKFNYELVCPYCSVTYDVYEFEENALKEKKHLCRNIECGEEFPVKKQYVYVQIETTRSWKEFLQFFRIRKEAKNIIA